MNTFLTVKETFDEVYGMLPIPVFLFDGNAQMVCANPAFLELARVTVRELPQLSVGIFFEVVRTFRFPVPERYVTELKTRDNAVIPVELNHIKFSGDDDTGMGCLVMLTDLRDRQTLQEEAQRISIEKDALAMQLAGRAPDADLVERSHLEQEIQSEKAFLENVIESCGDGIIILDGQGVITRANDAFTRIVGKSKSELVSSTLFDLGPAEGAFRSTTGETVTLDQVYRDYTYRQVEKFVALGSGGHVENWEYYVFNSRGEIVPLDATATMQKNALGVITGSVCVLRDVTERKKAERDLQEAYQFRSQFFANITHEFRTPLTLAIGPIEDILRGGFGDVGRSVADQLGVALRNSRRLLKLINQLLDFSMLESGAQNLVCETRDLKAFAAAILDSFSLIARKRKINLAFQPAADLPPVSIDPGKMEKVLFNLIGNAFKFTPDRGAITVSIDADVDHGGDAPASPRGVTLSVQDTGVGIESERLEHIFDRFHQGGGSYGRDYGGAGIGLAYAKELVEMMGGSISVTSTCGEGSAFSIVLPVDPSALECSDRSVDDLPLQAEIELSDVYQEQEADHESLSGEKPLVLIVDDNPDVRRYVAGALQDGYDFVTAVNGREALVKIEQRVPDLILCDVMMPVMDGYALLKQVKSRPGLQQTPFVFLTARAETDMKVEGLEFGADDYIVKPFNSLELRARVRALLRLRDLLAETETQQQQISRLSQQLAGKYWYGNIIGSSPPMRKIYQLIETIKDSDSHVLISGETGTGKELIANAIHYSSLRRSGTMVSVNCGAIPKELMEREFFGHVKGAYTGAVASRKGYFQEADGGTLFLDEIGEMDRDMQVKLLRVLERGEVVRVGDSAPSQVDVRLVAATNKNLLAEVQQGRFREDLYYRIHVIPIHLPPLRQRREDVPLLVEHFCAKLREKNAKNLPDIDEAQMRIFMDYAYPGNVRELEHMVERFCLLGGIMENLFPAQPSQAAALMAGFSCDELLSGPAPLKAAARLGKVEAEKELIAYALKLCNDDYAETARRLGIGRSSFYDKLKAYGLVPGAKPNGGRN